RGAEPGLELAHVVGERVHLRAVLGDGVGVDGDVVAHQGSFPVGRPRRAPGPPNGGRGQVRGCPGGSSRPRSARNADGSPPRMTSARDSGVPGAREPKASATCCSISARARPITSSTAADSSAGAMVRYLEVWNFSSVISPLAFTFALTVLSLDTASAVADSRFALASARLRCVS